MGNKMLHIFSVFLFIASAAGISQKGLSRIVGGSDAVYGEAPYMVSLQSGEYSYFYHFCGGVIYSPNYVITSASCFDGKPISNPGYMAVFAGDHNLDEDDGYEQQILLSSVTIHEDYMEDIYDNDIAILTLETALVFDSYVSAMPIAASGVVPTGPCKTFGWGDLEENGNPPTFLQKLTVPLVDDATCDDAHGEGEIASSMICGNGDGSGICQADEGGPLICDNGSGEFLAGVSFYRYGCATVGYPDIYTEISYFEQWITDNAP